MKIGLHLELKRFFRQRLKELCRGDVEEEQIARRLVARKSTMLLAQSIVLHNMVVLIETIFLDLISFSTSAAC